ncbi:hypothetical protein [Sphingobium sp. B2]|nr:hypothetical protein [Sphingobium sp. B2]
MPSPVSYTHLDVYKRQALPRKEVIDEFVGGCLARIIHRGLADVA